MKVIKCAQPLLLLIVSSFLSMPAVGWPLAQASKTALKSQPGISSEPKDKKASPLEAGWRAYQAGRINEAIAFYEQAASSTPNDSSILYDLGCLYALHQEPAKAQEALQRAIALNDSFADAFDALGQLHEQAGSFDLAKDAFLQADKLKPHSPAILKHLARLSLRSSDISAAKQRVAAWLDVDPKNPEAHYQLGSLHLRANNPDLAIIEFEQAVKYDPKHVLSWNGLGLAYSRIGDFKKTTQAFEKAQQLQPNNPVTFANIGVAAARQQQWEQARSAWKQALEITPAFTPAVKNLEILGKTKPEK